MMAELSDERLQGIAWEGNSFLASRLEEMEMARELLRRRAASRAIDTGLREQIATVARDWRNEAFVPPGGLYPIALVPTETLADRIVREHGPVMPEEPSETVTLAVVAVLQSDAAEAASMLRETPAVVAFRIFRAIRAALAKAKGR